MTDFLYTDTHRFDSSVLLQAWYDEDSRTLAVRLHNDTVACYTGVSSQTFYFLTTAPSAGAYWNSSIKNVHSGLNSDEFTNFTPRVMTAPVKNPTKTGSSIEYTVTVELSGRTDVAVNAADAVTAIREAQDKFAAFGLNVKVVSVNERD